MWYKIQHSEFEARATQLENYSFPIISTDFADDHHDDSSDFA